MPPSRGRKLKGKNNAVSGGREMTLLFRLINFEVPVRHLERHNEKAVGDSSWISGELLE